MNSQNIAIILSLYLFVKKKSIFMNPYFKKGEAIDKDAIYRRLIQ